VIRAKKLVIKLLFTKTPSMLKSVRPILLIK
jgi:hypothetical protein